MSVQHTPPLSRQCLDLLVQQLLCSFIQSVSINSLSFSQCCLVTFYAIPNKILLWLFTLGADLNLRQQYGVRFYTFLVIIVLNMEVHHLSPNDAEELSLLGI